MTALFVVSDPLPDCVRPKGLSAYPFNLKAGNPMLRVWLVVHFIKALKAGNVVLDTTALAHLLRDSFVAKVTALILRPGLTTPDCQHHTTHSQHVTSSKAPTMPPAPTRAQGASV